MGGFIISINLGGISNRIKCLVSMMRLADRYEKKLLLYWPLNHTCGAKFSDLFENCFDEINKAQMDNIKKEDIRKIGGDSIVFRGFPERYVMDGTWRFLLSEEEIKKYPFLNDRRESSERGIDLNFSDIPKDIKKSIIFHLKKIKPKKSIIEEADKFEEKHAVSKMIGVHIRRNDFADRKVSPGLVSSDEKFMERMKELIRENPETIFFLCTDTPEIEEQMEREFGSKIVKYPKTSFVRTEVRATQEGLIDLILLSRTNHILGTYRSTFNELAWWLGGCKARIEIPKDIEKEMEFFRNTERESKRLMSKIKKFILNALKK